MKKKQESFLVIGLPTERNNRSKITILTNVQPRTASHMSLRSSKNHNLPLKTFCPFKFCRCSNCTFLSLHTGMCFLRKKIIKNSKTQKIENKFERLRKT